MAFFIVTSRPMMKKKPRTEPKMGWPGMLKRS